MAKKQATPVKVPVNKLERTAQNKKRRIARHQKHSARRVNATPRGTARAMRREHMQREAA